MTPTFEALARRAVACPRWRWMPGMVDQHTRRVLDVNTGRNAGVPDWWTHAIACDVVEMYESPNKARKEWSDALPDLTDPATLGCLLALVREVYGSPSLYCRLSSTARKSDGIRAWEVIGWLAPYLSPDGRGGSFCGWGYASEAEALVAALETAP